MSQITVADQAVRAVLAAYSLITNLPDPVIFRPIPQCPNGTVYIRGGIKKF